MLKAWEDEIRVLEALICVHREAYHSNMLDGGLKAGGKGVGMKETQISKILKYEGPVK